MTESEAVLKIDSSCHSGDTECDHSIADDILIEFLEANGCAHLVQSWNNVKKWYA